MKKLLFVLLLFSGTLSAQFTRIVNGVSVPISRADSIALVQEWQANRAAQVADSATYSAALNNLRTIAQSAVGVQLQSLTAAQVRALFGIFLFKEGALTRDSLKVKPLNTWVR